MKIVLAAINAKYIHSNLAVYDLKAYAEKRLAESMETEEEEQQEICIQIAEYTINQTVESIIGSLYEMEGDCIAFSCYIWNIEVVCRVGRALKAIKPELKIWVGGPEVTYHGDTFLEENPFVDLVMTGEGERVFYKLIKGESIEQIDGIIYRQKGETVVHAAVDLTPMDEIPFVYQDLKEFEHRIIYYESSRGCPFGCTYCLSSLDKKVRFRSLSLVKQELQFFLEHRVPQVKFIDRTFNCNPERAMEIWKYILEHDNGVTNFHFEISADLLTEAQIELLGKMRKGLVQFEIGLQSTNPETIDAIRRHMDIEKIRNHMEQIHSKGNIHQHLDLIAGLPYENLEQFRLSFDQAYAMGAEQLQLGFLKVLKGSEIEVQAEQFGMIYMGDPPYEILATRWLSYEDMRKLKRVEEMLEVYHNSGQFSYSLDYLLKFQKSAFDFFLELGEYYKQHGFEGLQWKRLDRYNILRDFAQSMFRENSTGFEVVTLDRLLLHDLYLRENLKKRPDWAVSYDYLKRDIAKYFKNSGLAGVRMHLEPWREPGRMGYMLYNYEKRNPLDSTAETSFIWEKQFQEQIG